MKIAIVGTRGIPNRYGGFERFAEQISSRFADRGHEVTVYCRRAFTTPDDLYDRRVKRVIVPSLHQVAILAKIDNPSAALEIAEARAAAQTLGLGVGTIEIRRAEDISSAFEAANGRMNALYVCSDPLFAIGAFASGSWRSARERRRHGRSTELPDRPELVQKGSGSR